MKKLILLLTLILLTSFNATFARKIVKISVSPQQTAIYINNNLAGYGYAEFTKPGRNEVVVIRLECNEYNSVLTKFYGSDKRNAISYTLQQDGFYRQSAASGVVNKYLTINIDSTYCIRKENGETSTLPAWKKVHEVLLNYFNELSTSDYNGGYIQTPWVYKTFVLSEKQIRNRVTIRDISTPAQMAYQIKIESEVAGAAAARHGEFEAVDRIPKDFEGLVEELLTRIGKCSNR